MKAVLIGMKKFNSQKTGKNYTTVYLEYEDRETLGKACSDALIEGHELSEELINEKVEVEVDLRGRVQGVIPA